MHTQFPLPTKKQTNLKLPQQFVLFELFSLVEHVRLQEVSSLCSSKLWSPACQSFTLVGLIKESSKRLFPAVPSWDMPCGTLSFSVPDLNAMWQAVGSKADPAWCLAHVAKTYSTQLITTGSWQMVAMWVVCLCINKADSYNPTVSFLQHQWKTLEAHRNPPSLSLRDTAADTVASYQRGYI